MKLVPSKTDTDALVESLRVCNEALNYVSQRAFAERVWKYHRLQKLVYTDVKARSGLGAQMALHVIKKVADSYNSGKEAHRHGAALREFRWSSAQTFDARNLTISPAGQTISIGTATAGRIRVPYVCSLDQQTALAASTIKECDLVYRDGS